ncbi:MAG: zinc ribbon domain-containing protein [Chloroflexi bacterium]|nr:zinc ribbon domain-containing protein [Chloroflexota bacterium]
MQQWYQCPRCGAPVAFGSRFCTNCGTQLNWPTQQIQPPPVYQHPQQQWNYGYRQPGKEPKKTSSWLIGCLGLIGIILLIVGAYFVYDTSFQKNTLTPPLQPTTSPSKLIPPSAPSHNLYPTDIIKNPRYWNSDWDVVKLFKTIYYENKSYYANHQYIKGEFDCNDMAVGIWNTLYKKKIVSVIVAGNLELDNESFAECNHVWLLVFYRGAAGGVIFIVETTNGETYFINSPESEFLKYLHGYYYLSPSDLRADIKERW